MRKLYTRARQIKLAERLRVGVHQEQDLKVVTVLVGLLFTAKHLLFRLDDQVSVSPYTLLTLH